MAAAVDGITPLCLEQEQTCVEDGETKKKQVALMEKLRTKRGCHHKSWTESLMKSIRTSVVDRRLQGDSSERNQVQSCLYTLQRAMKGISQQSLVERLEVVARHQGLTVVTNSSDESCVTLQADMFHIEIALNKGGGVKEVKIAHQGDASVCHELTEILSRGDFPEFTSHLEGLQSIYQVTGEKKLKPKVFLALQSLEKDLSDLAQFQNSISGVANYIHKSPLGILLPRTAGKPMKLIYFVSPYDLLDKKSLSAHPMTVEAITQHGLGRSVTVCLESGPANKLQTMPLMSVTKNLPSFNGLTHANSANLPACFVLVLPQPVPVAMSVLQKIRNLTKMDTAKDMGTQPLLSLILDSNSGGKMKKEQQLFVSLPDQDHCYFISGVNGGVLEEPGVMVSRIPFSHPTHVPKILMYLRQQLLFNSVLASCVRPAAKKDVTSCLVFEMTLISLTQMMVVFEHPAHDTMVTVDMDLSDITNLKCHLLGTSSDFSLCTDDYASRVLQRCLSLPILLRALVRKGRSQLEKLMAEAQALAEEQARRAQEAALWMAAQLRQQQARLPPSMPSKTKPPPPQPPPLPMNSGYPPTPSPIISNPPSVGDLPMIAGGVDFLGSSPPPYPGTLGPEGDAQEKQNNPLLVTLLDNGHGVHAGSAGTSHAQVSSGMSVNESPMLSKLLEDNISVATNITPIHVPSGVQQAPPKSKGTKGRKRRSQSDVATGRSPKHRVIETESMERFASMDFESSSSPYESSLGGSGGLTSFHHQMGPAQPSRPSSHGHMSSVIDLTEENMQESSLKKLVNFSNFIPPQDIRVGNSTPESELHALLNEQDLSSSPSASLKSNQMTGSKNENASTSLEGFLTGSGEVGKASLPDPRAVHSKVQTNGRSSSSSSMVSFLGHGQATSRIPQKANLPGLPKQVGGLQRHVQNCRPAQQQVFNAGKSNKGMSAGFAMAVNTGPRVVSSGSMTEALDIKPTLPHWRRNYRAEATDSDHSVVADKQDLFEKFDFMEQTVSSSHLIITSSCVSTTSARMEGGNPTAPKVRLKLQPFRTPFGKSQSVDSGAVQSPSSAGSRSSSSNTFDFCSDEDDDDLMPKNFTPTEHFSVYCASPTRLQISSKGRPSNILAMPDSALCIKPEKYKRKDKASGHSKRRKGRSDSKKKKRKHDSDFYLPSYGQPMYRASTIEGDHKTGTKLKIRVSKEPIMTSSSVKEHYHVDIHSEKAGKFSERVNNVLKTHPVAEKLVLQKQDRDNVQLVDDGSKVQGTGEVYRSASGKSSFKTVTNGMIGITDDSSSLNKVDPKLAKATIRLKPLDLNSAMSSSVCLSAPMKIVTSGGNHERGNQSLCVSSLPSTSTSTALSVVNIVRDAQTPSGTASLPPVPKISRTSPVMSNCNTFLWNSSIRSNSVISEGGKHSSINCDNPVTQSHKASGSPAEDGSRSGSISSASSSHPSKSIGVNMNKASQQRRSLTSPALPGHKSSGNTNVSSKVINSGSISQNCSFSQKAGASGNQEWQKESDRFSPTSSMYNRDLSSSHWTQGSQSEERQMNMLSQTQGTLKDCRINGIVSTEGVNQSGCGSVKKQVSLRTQTGCVQVDSPSSQHLDHQHANPVHIGSGVSRLSPADFSSQLLQQGSKPSQKNLTLLDQVSPKSHELTSSKYPPSPTPGGLVSSAWTGNWGQDQKLSGSPVHPVFMKSHEVSSKDTEAYSKKERETGVSGGSISVEQPPLPIMRDSPRQEPGQEAGPSVSPCVSISSGPFNPAGLASSSNTAHFGDSASAPSRPSICTAQNCSPETDNSNPVQTGMAQRPVGCPSVQTTDAVSSPIQHLAGTPGIMPEGGNHHAADHPKLLTSASPHQSPENIRTMQADSSGIECRGSQNTTSGRQGIKSDSASTGLPTVVSQGVEFADSALQAQLASSKPVAAFSVSPRNESEVFKQKTETSHWAAALPQQNACPDSGILGMFPVESNYAGLAQESSRQVSCNVKNLSETSGKNVISIDDDHMISSVSTPFTNSNCEVASQNFVPDLSDLTVVRESDIYCKQTDVQSRNTRDRLSPGNTGAGGHGSVPVASGSAAPKDEAVGCGKKMESLCAKDEKTVSKTLVSKTVFSATDVNNSTRLNCGDSSCIALSRSASNSIGKTDTTGSLSTTETNVASTSNTSADKRPTETVLNSSVKAASSSKVATSSASLSSVPCTAPSSSVALSSSGPLADSFQVHEGCVSTHEKNRATRMKTSRTASPSAECEEIDRAQSWKDNEPPSVINLAEGEKSRQEEGVEEPMAAKKTTASVPSLSHGVDAELKGQYQQSQMPGSVVTTVSSPALGTHQPSAITQADVKSAPALPSLADSRSRVSSKDSGPTRCGSPAVGYMKMFSGKKLNGEFGRDRSGSGKDMFFACTPRSPLIEQVGHSNTLTSHGDAAVNVSRKCYADRHPIAANPLCHPGSPENKVTMDCEENYGKSHPCSFTTSRTMASTSLPSVYPTAKRVGELNSKRSPSLSACGVKTSSWSTSHLKPSPPHVYPFPETSSPCDIDEDLMDTALMSFTAS